MKQYVKQQEEIKHIKDFIASCGTYANLVRQAKSRQKVWLAHGNVDASGYRFLQLCVDILSHT